LAHDASTMAETRKTKLADLLDRGEVTLTEVTFTNDELITLDEEFLASAIDEMRGAYIGFAQAYLDAKRSDGD
ncbi:MAG: hypothetical protein V3V06_04505, partial [Dehalococcoidia bacterium]